MKDIFVSYNSADKSWAEWIAWVLEEHEFTVIIQAWDFLPGGNFVLDMQKAASDCKYTVCVLSENYLNAKYTHSEWAVAFSKDPMGQERNLIPVRIKPCNLLGLLKPLTYVDLVDKPETEAEQLLVRAFRDRLKPDVKPGFPGQVHQATRAASKVPFPGNTTKDKTKAEGLIKASESCIPSNTSSLSDVVEDDSPATLSEETIEKLKELELDIQSQNKILKTLNARERTYEQAYIKCQDLDEIRAITFEDRLAELREEIKSCKQKIEILSKERELLRACS